MFRKLDVSEAGLLHDLLDEVREAATGLLERDHGPVLHKFLTAGADALLEAAASIARARKGDRDWALAVASPFLDAAAVIITGGLLARQLATTVTSRRREAAAVYHLLYLVPEATTQLASLDAVAHAVEVFQ